MRNQVTRFGLLMALSGAVVVGGFVYGCGSDDESPPAEQGGAAGASGGAGDASVEAGEGGGAAGADGSTIDVKPNCELVGSSCAAHSDCCSAVCDEATHACINPPIECKPAGAACTVATECCTTVCTGGVCGANVCTSDNEACVADDACCSGKCAIAGEPVPEAGTDSEAGTAAEAGVMSCQPLNPSCGTVGNACAQHSDCCSKYCFNDRCSGSPSYCTQNGDACSDNMQCCTGLCDKADGDLIGLCKLPAVSGVPGCLVAGEVCGAGALGDPNPPVCGGECCSRSCMPYGPTGVMICQPPSGCRPTGEACQSDADCCGSEGMPGGNGSVTCSKNDGQPVGRCDNGQACRPAGAICKLATTSCNAENNCCAGNVNQDPLVCQLDLLGIPRCTGVGSCDPDAGSYAGKDCATSADCCGLPCVPNPDANGAPFLCGGSCVPAGGACSTDADCCAGLPCNRPAGSSVGICGYQEQDGGVPEGGVPEAGTDAELPDTGTPDSCAYVGQECTVNADCCNNIPCTNGRCYQKVF